MRDTAATFPMVTTPRRRRVYNPQQHARRVAWGHKWATIMEDIAAKLRAEGKLHTRRR